MPYIVSRLAAGVSYVTYKKQQRGGKPLPTGSVLVKGGADVADKRTLITPLGVLTEVKPEEVEQLRNNPIFVEQEKDGFLKVLDKKPDPEKAAASLDKDSSAQMTEADYLAAGKTPPTTGAAE